MSKYPKRKQNNKEQNKILNREYLDQLKKNLDQIKKNLLNKGYTVTDNGNLLPPLITGPGDIK